MSCIWTCNIRTKRPTCTQGCLAINSAAERSLIYYVKWLLACVWPLRVLYSCTFVSNTLGNREISCREQSNLFSTCAGCVSALNSRVVCSYRTRKSNNFMIYSGGPLTNDYSLRVASRRNMVKVRILVCLTFLLYVLFIIIKLSYFDIYIDSPCIYIYIYIYIYTYILHTYNIYIYIYILVSR